MFGYNVIVGPRPTFMKMSSDITPKRVKYTFNL